MICVAIAATGCFVLLLMLATGCRLDWRSVCLVPALLLWAAVCEVRSRLARAR